MRTNFNEMITPTTLAGETLISAMITWWMASDRDDAIRQMNENPGCDLAGIGNSVKAGLTKAAQILGCDPAQFIFEEDLTPLANLSASEIVEILDAIHLQWIEDNFTAKRWGEKYFKGVLSQYRKTAKIPFDEVVKDLLFVEKYLTAGGSTVTIEEIAEAFASYATAHASDDDLPEISERARTLVPDIISGILTFREKSAKKPAVVADIDAFLANHQDPAEIIELMLATIS